jgi:hypothetical protein
MFTISVKPQQNGLALFIDAPEGVQYHIEFLVLGTGGRETSGVLDGVTANGGTWRHQRVAFPVVRVAMTEVYLSPHQMREADAWKARPINAGATHDLDVFRSSADAAFMTRAPAAPPLAEGAVGVPYASIPHPLASMELAGASIPYTVVPYAFEESHLAEPYPGVPYP